MYSLGKAAQRIHTLLKAGMTPKEAIEFLCKDGHGIEQVLRGFEELEGAMAEAEAEAEQKEAEQKERDRAEQEQRDSSIVIPIAQGQPMSQLVVSKSMVDLNSFEFKVNGEVVATISEMDLATLYEPAVFDFHQQQMIDDVAAFHGIEQPAAETRFPSKPLAAPQFLFGEEIFSHTHANTTKTQNVTQGTDQNLPHRSGFILVPADPSESYNSLAARQAESVAAAKKSKWDMPEPEPAAIDPEASLTLVDQVAKLAAFYFEVKATAALTSDLKGLVTRPDLDGAMVGDDGLLAMRELTFEAFVKEVVKVCGLIADAPCEEGRSGGLERHLLRLIERRQSQIKNPGLADSVKQLEIYMLDVVFVLVDRYLGFDEEYKGDWDFCRGPVTPDLAASMMTKALEDELRTRAMGQASGGQAVN